MNQPKRILVYEDDEICSYAMAKTLAGKSYIIEVASNFKDALRVIEDGKILDLIIVDVVFPPGQVNGLAMARMARMKQRGLKVIYVTGFRMSPVEDEAFGPILDKPVLDDVLIAEVERALASAS